MFSEAFSNQCVTQLFDGEKFLVPQYHTLNSAPNNTLDIRTAFTIKLFQQLNVIELELAATRRFWLAPDQRFPHTGFRCAAAASGPAAAAR